MVGGSVVGGTVVGGLVGGNVVGVLVGGNVVGSNVVGGLVGGDVGGNVVGNVVGGNVVGGTVVGGQSMAWWSRSTQRELAGTTTSHRGHLEIQVPGKSKPPRWRELMRLVAATTIGIEAAEAENAALESWIALILMKAAAPGSSTGYGVPGFVVCCDKAK